MRRVFPLRLLPGNTIARRPNGTAKQPPHFAPLETRSKLLPFLYLFRGMGPADVGRIPSVERIGPFVDVWAMLAVVIRRGNDQQPARSEQSEHVAHCALVVHDMFHHANARHGVEWAVKFSRLGDIDVKDRPVAVHHLVVPIIADVVDRGCDKTAVPQKMWPRRSTCSDIQHGLGTCPRQTLKGKPILNRSFVVMREFLFVRFRRTDTADIPVACLVYQRLEWVIGHCFLLLTVQLRISSWRVQLESSCLILPSVVELGRLR